MRKYSNDSLYSIAADYNRKSSNTVVNNRTLIIWLVVSFLYTILKMYRNSMGGSNGSVGGVWNFLNISYVALAAILFMSCVKKSIPLPVIVKEGFVYSFYVAAVALLNPRELTINTIFSYAMIFYFVSVTFTFYYAMAKGFSRTEYIVYNIVYFVLAVFTLYLMYSRLAYNQKNVYQSDAYFLLCAMPLVLLLDKGSKMYIKLAPLVVCLMMAAKRTGFIGMAGGIFIYYLIDCVQKKKLEAFLKTLFKIAIVIGVFFIAYFYLEDKLGLTLLDRMETVTTDGGSGRDDIYTGVWQAIKESHLLDILFGHGLNGIQVVFGRKSGAHDDFLEIMYNYGVFALMLLIYLYIKMVTTCIKMTKSGYPGAKATGAAIVISLLMSLFSNYFVTFTQITVTATFWGIVLADWNHYQYNKSISGGY